MLEKHFFDFESLPYSFDYGVGIEIIHENRKYISEGSYNKDGYRCASFSVSSYPSCGTHYYGRVSFYTHIRDIIDNTTVFIPGMKIPNQCNSVSFDVLRELSQEEIDKYPFRFDPRFHEKGDLVNAFYSEEDLINTFKSVVNHIFKGKWEIDCDYWTYSEKILIDN